jgi:hypothetical protein
MAALLRLFIPSPSFPENKKTQAEEDNSSIACVLRSEQ